MKAFFPENAVEYFVSYYDYYQPEAYIASKDLYIEKDASINEKLDLLRHSATRALLERRDVIVVSSVSCIYGLGAPELYLQMAVQLAIGQKMKRDELAKSLVQIQYTRNDINLERGNFRVRGSTFDVFPSHYQDRAWKIVLDGNVVTRISEFDPLTGSKIKKLDKIVIFANSHYVTPKLTLEQAMVKIREELKERIVELKKQEKIVEAHRIEQRVNFDLEMLQQTGHCKGIENYSRYLSGKAAGEPPPTLFEYLPDNALLIVDESHVTVPQIRAMYNGDYARKRMLIDHGFRLPSALDNRPLKFEEWLSMRPQTLFVSATPGSIELEFTNNKYTEQIIRPTGLLDPKCIIRPAASQVDDLLEECRQAAIRNERVLVTALTKRMAEDLTAYLTDIQVKAAYLHSEVKTLERIEIIQDLRKGKFDVLVGVNLLREGLDIPECSLIAILDADKEGFLRSETSLIQTIGRAARNRHGRAILYADNITQSIEKAVNITAIRRKKQEEYNEKHCITPVSISKAVSDDSIVTSTIENLTQSTEEVDIDIYHSQNLELTITKLKVEMRKYADDLDFEKAAELRDQIKRLEQLLLLE